MASILRSALYTSYIFGKITPFAARVRISKCIYAVETLCNYKYSSIEKRSYSTTENLKEKEIIKTDNNATSVRAHKENLDQAFFHLDNDVRKMGRISFKDIEEIFQQVQDTGKITSTQSLLALRCCGILLPDELPEKRSEFVNNLWSELIKLGVDLDVSHHNALLKVYLENEYKFIPTEILATMEKQGIEPNRVTYQRLIAHYCQQGDVSGAGKILEYMKEKSLPISEVVFNALIQGHARANDMDGAKGILDVMKSAKLEPSAETYTMLLCCYGEKGDINAIRETIKEAEVKEVYLLDRDYMEVIYSLSANGHGKYAEELLDKMKRVTGYNQDAVNIIMRLINKGQIDIAYKMLHTMNKSKTSDNAGAGLFFVRQLVRANVSLEKILQICADLQKTGFNNLGLTKALEISMATDKMDQSIQILHEMKKQNVALRPHYFWPIFASYTKLKEENKIYELTKLMSTLDCHASYDTFFDYVYPAINTLDSDFVVQKFKDLGYTIGNIVNPLVAYNVSQNKLNIAVQLVKSHPVRLSSASWSKLLASAYHETKNLDDTLTILAKVEDSNDLQKRTDWTGSFVLEYMKLCNNEPSLLEPLLKGLETRGLNISSNIVENLYDRIKKIPEEAKVLLERLGTASVNTADEIENAHNPREISIDELESHLIELKNKNMNTRGVLRRLLLLHCRYKNTKRALEIKAELDSSGFVYSSAMYAQIMDLFVNDNNLTEAVKYKNLIYEKEPDFPLDYFKMLNLASLMAKKDLTADAVKLIEEYTEKHGKRDLDDLTKTSEMNVWRVLNARAEKGDTAETKRLFELLTSNGYSNPTTTVLGPIIKSYLVRDDLNGAIEEFEKCCKTYNHTPWKNELFLRLIQIEDADRLQKIVDLSSDVHGETNTLYDLSFAFLNAGRVKQAKKIMETPGLRARHQRLNAMCDAFIKENKITELENLVYITKDLFDIDRDFMYYQLLRGYCKLNNTDKAVGIWTQMQEENVLPSDNTLRYLADFLIANNKPVPFAIPKNEVSSTPTPISTSSPMSHIYSVLKENKLDEALELKSRLESSGQKLSFGATSSLIEKLIQADRINDALQITYSMIDRGVAPTQTVLRFLLSKISNAGDVETLQKLEQKMDKKINAGSPSYFSSLKTNAYIERGQHIEVLESWEKESQTLSNKESFPISSILKILAKHPELESRVEELCSVLATKHDFVLPMNMLWIHHMTLENYSRAEEIFKLCPQLKSFILFGKVLMKARITNNETMVRKVMNFVPTHETTKSTKGYLYSSLINILTTSQKFDDAIIEVKKAQQEGINLREIGFPVLRKLKFNMENNNQVFPFEIPQAEDKITDQTSSSFDEEFHPDSKFK